MTKSRITAGIAVALWLSLTPSPLESATVTVLNADSAGVGFNDPTPVSPVGGNLGTTLGQQRMIAFQAAANKWGATLTSNVTIRVSATWTALTCNVNSAVLGSAGATEVFRDFGGAPLGSHWYPKALADAISNVDLDGSTVDISANFNVNLGNSGCLTGIFFYLGLDNNHGSSVDLVAVVTHELAHGLGFLTFTNGQSGAQFNNFPSIWDDFLLDNTTNKTWTIMSPAERVASAVNTGHLVWNGGNVTSAIPQVLQSQGSSFVGADALGRGMMYSPNPFQPGSSVSHFSTSMFPNQLMEPAINYDLTHEVTPPNDLTFPLLKDIGWTGASGNSPRLAISKTHTANFTQGQAGATYSVTVSNQAGAGPTNGLVTMTETVPPGLSLVSMSGTGWSCLGLTCTRSDVLNGGASYLPITVTVNVAANASSPQVNQVSVSGGGSVTANAGDSTVIAAVPPGQATLISPATGATGQSTTPALSWTPVNNATAYDLYLGTSNPPALYSPNLSITSFTVTNALSAGTTYFWNVVAKNGAGSAPASSTSSFTTAAASVPGQVTLASPASGAANQSTTPTLNWSAAINAASYDLFLGTSNPPPVYVQNLSSTSFGVTTALNAGTTYFWNVVAKNGAGSAPASSTWSFTTAASSGGGGLPTLQQKATCSFGQPVTCSFPSGVSAGDLIVILVANGTGCSITSTPSNVFSPAVSTVDPGGMALGSYYAGSVASGTNSIKIACSGFPYAAALDVFGVSALDQAGTATKNSQSISVTTAGPVTASTEYVVAAAEVSNVRPAYVAGSGYTNQVQFFANFAAVEDNNTRTGLSGTQTAAFDSGQPTAIWASLILTFKSVGSVPGQVTLIAPGNGAANQSTTPTLSWTVSSNATSYDLYLGSSNPPALYAQNLSGASFGVTTALNPGATYFWNVVAKNGAGSAPASSTSSFTTAAAVPGQVTLTSPANGSTNQSTTPRLDWSVASNATSYDLYLGTSNPPPLYVNAPGPGLNVTTALNPGTTYFWNVIAKNGAGSAPVSSTWSFTTAASLPGQVALTSPGTGATSQSTTPTLNWSAASNATLYDLYLGTTNPPAVYAQNLSNTSFAVSTALNAGTTYFWNVIAKNSGGSAPASSTWSFTTATSLPGQVTLTSPASGAANQSTTPTLSWSAASNATSYDLCLGTSNPPAVYAQSLSATSFAVTTALNAGTTYFWSVIAKNSGGSAPPSSVWSFTTAASLPGQVTLASPVSGATNQSATPTLSWSAASNATSYDLYLGTSSPPPVYVQNLSSTSFAVSTPLNAGTTYFWNVVARNSAGSAPASSTWSFTTAASSGGAPPTLRQKATCSAGQPVTCSFPSGVPAGDLIVVFVANGTGCSVTSTPSNVFSPAVSSMDADGISLGSYYAGSVASGTNSVRIACSGFPYASVLDVSGVSALDQAGALNGTSQVTSVTTSGPVTASTQYVVAAAVVSNVGPVFVAGPGYTNQARFFANFAAVEDNTTRTGLSGTQTATFDSGQPSAIWASLILTFKSVGSGSVPGQVTLASPASGATNQSTTPTLSWTAASNATSYDLYLGTSNPPPIYSQNLSGTSFAVTTALNAGATYFWNVVATNSAGSAPASGTWSFTTVAASLPAQVTLISPASGAANQSTTPTLNWAASSNATSYDLYLGTTNPPAVYAQNLPGTSFGVTTALNAGGTYFWNVVAKNSAGSAPASSTWSFTTTAPSLPGQVTLTSPASGATNQTVTPMLSWSAASNATSYDLYLGTGNPPAVYAQNLSGTSFGVSTALNAGTTYFWNVIAKNIAGAAPASSTWSFTTAASLPGQVTLTSPASGATNQSTAPTLSWSAASNATSYDLYLGTSNPPPVYAQNLSSTGFTVSTALSAGTTYFWNVIAKNSAGSAPASSTWAFTTAASGGAPPTLRQKATCSTGQPVTCSFPSGAPAGDLIVVFVANGTGCSVTSTPSNAFSPAVSTKDADGISLGSYYAGSVASGTNSIRIACSGFPYASVLDVSGVSALDQTGALNGTSQITSVTTASPVTATTEYVVAAAVVSNVRPAFVAGSGYTNQAQFFANFAGVEDNNTRTGLSGTQTATFDSGQSSAIWASLILTFK